MARRNNGKRPIEMIDLTDDNALLEPQSRRKIPRPSGLDAQPFSQSQRDTWVNQDEEEDDADHVIILSQDGDDSAAESLELYGKNGKKKQSSKQLDKRGGGPALRKGELIRVGRCA